MVPQRVFSDLAVADELIAVRDALSGLVILVGEVRELPTPAELCAVMGCIAVRLDRAVAGVGVASRLSEPTQSGAVSLS